MSGRNRRAWLSLFLLTALPAGAADLLSLEHALSAAVAARDRAVSERRRLVDQASGLADTIAGLKRAHSGPRAGAQLEKALKEFDRIAADLDEFDREVRDQERRIVQARQRFDEEVTTETARLAARRGAAIDEVARQMGAIDQARNRVSRLDVGDRVVRPALDIALLPADGPLEVEQKIALAEAERDRFAIEQARLDKSAAVVVARLLIKEQILSALDGAARAGGSELALLTREATNARQATQDLLKEQDRIGRQKAALARSLTALERQLEEFRRRLRALKERGERP